MKNRVKRIAALCLSGMIVSGMLTGCGGNAADSHKTESGKNSAKDDENETGQAGKEKQADGTAHEPLTISFYNSLLSEEFFASFHEAYPEVNLEIISYSGTNGSGYALHSLKHGDITDIYISTQNFDKEAQEKYLLDLSNYDFVNDYSTALLDAQDVNGSIYLLPSGYQLTGIYYNKTIMEENGWTPPESFDELVALSEEIEAAGYRTFGNAMDLDGYPFNFFFNIGNTKYFSTPDGYQWKEDFPKGEAKAGGNARLKETADYFNQWIEHGFITPEHMDVSQFYEGESVFYLCLNLTYYEHTASDGKKYEFGTIPWLSGDGSGNMLTRTVSRYMGINRELTAKGNEQKLEDALKFLSYVSTPEGQRSFMTKDAHFISSLNDGEIPEDSPYQEIAGLVMEGRTVPLVYIGWEQHIIPIAQDIKRLITGEINTDEMMEAFDRTNKELLEGSSDDIYAAVEDTLTLDETARFVATAEGKAVDADCALISLNQYHGAGLSNKQGLAWYLYEGVVSLDTINMVRPRATTISVLTMTGAEIKAMREAGFDLDGNGNPYEYLLFTKGDMELEDETVYKMAVSTGELTEDMLVNARETEISPAQAIINYSQELGTVTADKLYWE